MVVVPGLNFIVYLSRILSVSLIGVHKMIMFESSTNFVILFGSIHIQVF